MAGTVRIALVGDHDPRITAHAAIPPALDLAAAVVGCRAEPVWTATDTVGDDPAGRLGDCAGVWCVPGSPYASLDGALRAIRWARESPRPYLGTCGGFQHALLEYARNALGLTAADHAESNPDTELPLVSALECPLTETPGEVRFEPGSLAGRAYGRDSVTETYNCRFGLNPRYAEAFARGPLRFTGFDAAGAPRVAELPGHPFFVATLYQPERSARTGQAHPLIVAFLRAAARPTTAA
jgi:CTP synthase (UTP-ammonia lyase)